MTAATASRTGQGGVSMLARLVATVETTAPAKTKAKRQATLTPLPAEAPVTARTGHPLQDPPPASVPFPYDSNHSMIQSALADAERQVNDLRTHIEFIAKGIEALKVAYAAVPSTVDVVDEAKIAERAADAAAAEREKLALNAKVGKEMQALGAEIAAGDKAAAAVLSSAAAVGAVTKAAMIDKALTEMVEGDGEDFAARMARLSTEAQDATFTRDNVADSTVEGGEDPEPTAGWNCPKHHQATIKTSPRRGRQYRACPVAGCQEFERL